MKGPKGTQTVTPLTHIYINTTLRKRKLILLSFWKITPYTKQKEPNNCSLDANLQLKALQIKALFALTRSH